MRVTQSKMYNDDCEAANAVDRDLTSMAASLPAVNVNGEAWLKLEFDKSYFINRVAVYFAFYTNWFFNDFFTGGESDFKGLVDSSNNVDVSVYLGPVKRKSCGTLQLTYGLRQSDQIYTINCIVEGDTVKFSKTSGRIIIFEVVVLTLAGNYNYIVLTRFFPAPIITM